MKIVVVFSFIILTNISFSQSPKRFFKWGEIDNPDNFLISYETKFKNLPLKGKLKKQPWSGYYWATYKRWNHLPMAN